MARLDAPGPTIDVFRVIAGKGLPNVMTPVSPFANVIVPPFDKVLAFEIAVRSVPAAELSVSVVTTKFGAETVSVPPANVKQ
jgi:hypothetical protein